MGTTQGTVVVDRDALGLLYGYASGRTDRALTEAEGAAVSNVCGVLNAQPSEQHVYVVSTGEYSDERIIAVYARLDDVLADLPRPWLEWRWGDEAGWHAVDAEIVHAEIDADGWAEVRIGAPTVEACRDTVTIYRHVLADSAADRIVAAMRGDE